ncbi:hypothetical protein SAMN05444673_3423 [Bacillus sp. OV166]|jgi:hypothetical protein|uniref:hypothetical protein n=1 Tax=Bacillus sp. OV166 TaxID=1882763 RepID=UPI000A2AC5D8|nr:hypothetical protein [Bacillus sp. OV166]SMQ78416.1 hypothetical protein SAMN05444673_3423 [Bacillus sp. OV166]
MIQNQFTGIVENGEFHIRKKEPHEECNKLRLTKIPLQAAQTPESAIIDLSSYEGKTITVSGKEDGCWIFSANII